MVDELGTEAIWQLSAAAENNNAPEPVRPTYPATIRYADIRRDQIRELSRMPLATVLRHAATHRFSRAS